MILPSNLYSFWIVLTVSKIKINMKKSFLLGFVAILCWGCAKDELTMPVSVKLQMEIESGEVAVNSRMVPNTIHIERGRYLLSEVAFKGYRESGADYFFEREYEPGLEVAMETGRMATAISFDMPQGLYERIAISLKVEKSEGNEKEGGKPYNEQASLILYGSYTNVLKQQVPLIFVYNYDDTFEFNARSDKGQHVIAVGGGNYPKARIRFKPSYWLQQLNSRMLQGAKLTLVNGVPTIVLSEQQNEQIFNVLTSRIKKASDLSFE